MKEWQNQGFTLLEVLVSLAIFAMLALATGRATQVHLSTWSLLEEKSLAGILASNAVEIARASHKVPSLGHREEVQEIGGLTLKVTTSIEETKTPGYLSIDVEVSQDNDSSTQQIVLYRLESGRYVSNAD